MGPLQVLTVCGLGCILNFALRASAENEQAQCTMVSKTTCYQYGVAKIRNMTCNVHNQFTQCQQGCNAGNCNLSCQAPDACKQQCFAGRCRFLECKSKQCNQYCIRGRCEMSCNSEECFQQCDVGGCEMMCPVGVKRCIQRCTRGNCRMQCPAGVQYCQQSCESGRCRMLCNAKECKRSCREGRCVYISASENSTARSKVSTCNQAAYPRLAICYQQCKHGNCDVVSVKNDTFSMLSQVCYGGNCNLACNAKETCSQVCVGQKCQLMTCTSDVCIQECIAGGCHMECYSNVCSQICRGGGCTMGCLSSGTRSCQQACIGGGCSVSCDGHDCNPSCYGGKCMYSRYRPPGLIKSDSCVEVVGNTCIQTCVSKEGCALTYNPAISMQSTNQTCKDGFCSMDCTTSNECYQECSGRKCEVMSCNARECVQVCSGKDCGLVECDAAICTQICATTGCHLKCHPSVQICNQYCNANNGRCSLECRAEKCVTTML